MKTNSKNKAGLQSRPEQVNTAKRIDFGKRRANCSLNTENLLVLLRNEAPRFWELAEVVGKWVWIQFERKQPVGVTAALSQLGFHWNNTRQTWQHPCGVFCDGVSPIDPRRKYGSYFVADRQAA